MKEEIIIRKYIIDDKQQVIDLLNRNFKSQEHMRLDRDVAWWNWKYENNIFGKPKIYVAEHNERIIGVRPMWPWNLNRNGRIITCLEPVDTVVDKEYRGMGIFTKLAKKALEDNKNKFDIIFNFPNDQSLKGNLNLGWRYVSQLHWLVKINDFKTIFSVLKNNTGFKSIYLDKEDAINETKINQTIEPLDNSSMLITTKTKQYLKWRFLEHPKINYGFKRVEENKRSIYYLFEINENEFGRELIVLDYFGDLELFSKMLMDLTQLSKKYKVTYTLIIHKNTLKDLPVGFKLKNLLIKQKRKNFVVLPLKEKYKHIAVDYSNWEMCLGMHDSV